MTLPHRTTRLILRTFARGDYATIRALGDDARVREYSPKDSRAVEAARRAGARTRTPRALRAAQSYELGVEVRRTGKLIGACDLALIGRREADIGYMLLPRHWGHGYATEIARALIDAAFRELQVDRVSATIATENERSRRVLEKAGFVWEGMLRRHIEAAVRSWDCHLYVIDRPRWVKATTPCAMRRRRRS